MSLQSGLDNLRQSVAAPGDPLYQHLTDLMQALEEANTTSVTPSPPSSAQKSAKGQSAKSSRCASMRSRSDSSAEELLNTKSYATEATVDPGSDTDGESRPLQPRPMSASSAIKISRLRPPTSGFPAESDSFPETLTPSGRRGHRRKRLVKKMAVDDSPTDCPMELCARERRSAYKKRHASEQSHNSSMECDLDSSSVSSSDSEFKASSDDGGRQGDDEQSDWPWEPSTLRSWSRGSGEGECMGVPSVRASLPRRQDRDTVCNSNAEAHSSHTVESSDTDMSLSSCSKTNAHRYLSKRWLTKPGLPAFASINRKLLQFIHNPRQQQYSVSQLRKGEKQHLMRLAAFYRLDVHFELKRRRKCLVLAKNSETRTDW